MALGAGASNSSRSRSIRAVGALGVLVAVLLTVLTIQLVETTSPYRDTAFQIQISREPAFGDAVDRMVADIHAPGAQTIFWVGARVGLDSISQQRALSILLASAAYVGAILFGVRWRRTRATFPDGPLFLVTASGLVVLSSGVFAVSGMVRYSSFTGPIWLVAFLLVVRAARGEGDLIPALGLILGWGVFVTYGAAAPLGLVVVMLGLSKATRSARSFMDLIKGLAPGLAATALWLVYAGSEHLSSLRDRSGAARPSTLRSIAGHLYEMGVWLFTGPATLPTVTGITIIVLVGAAYGFLLLRRPVFAGVGATPFLLFTVFAVPFLAFSGADTGWSMAGPTAVVAFAAAIAIGRFDRRAVHIGAAFLVTAAVVSALTAADVAVLRPEVYSSKASEAFDTAASLLPGDQPVAYVTDDWNADLLASDASRDLGIIAVIGDDLLEGDPQIPASVVLILEDPIRSRKQPARQRSLRDRLEELGYTAAGPPIAAGDYDNLALRKRLDLVTWDSQFVVQPWSKSDEPP